jgi:glyoxylase-like metal-dependent hydrolase (beta-lactamase superfamily II)
MPQDMLAAYAAERPFNFSTCVAPIPPGFRAIAEDEQIVMAGRHWTVRLGHGHAPAQATLWSGDGLVLAGDQVLPGISPNISVYPTEPEADPLGEWLESCARLRADARPGDLALPGHKLPFRGLAFRLGQLASHHEAALDRLEAALGRGPLTAAASVPSLFTRPIGASEYGLALGEAVAHLNRLCRTGRARRVAGPHGAWLYHLAES